MAKKRKPLKLETPAQRAKTMQRQRREREMSAWVKGGFKGPSPTQKRAERLFYQRARFVPDTPEQVARQQQIIARAKRSAARRRLARK